MTEGAGKWIQTPEQKRKENVKVLLDALGRDGTEEELAEVEAQIALLREEIEKTPKVGRMLEQEKGKRNEFIIPIVSREQQELLVNTLSELGIFPWEEQGLLIIDRKSDLRKLELAGIAKNMKYREEKTGPDIETGPDVEAKRFAFPLPPQEPVERRRREGPPTTKESFDTWEQEPGVDTELLEIVRKFDEGVLDDDDPEFVAAFGDMPTLKLFPHKYVWNAEERTRTNVRTGEVIGAEEEAALLEKARQGDPRAANEFVRMHVGFVVYIAKQVHKTFGGDIDELFQNGLLGLEFAMRKYSPEESEGAKFTSYAGKCVEGYMRKGLAFDRSPIHVPANPKKTAVYRLRTKEGKKQQLLGPEYGTDDDQYLLSGIERLERRFLIGAQFDPIDSHFDEEAWKLQDHSGNQLVQAPEQDEQADSELLKQRINKVLLTLTPREEMIIRLRFGLGEFKQEKPPAPTGSNTDGLTLEAVGEIMGIHRERVRTIEAKALRKMKHPAKSIKLSGFYPRWTRDGLTAPEDQPFERKERKIGEVPEEQAPDEGDTNASGDGRL